MQSQFDHLLSALIERHGARPLNVSTMEGEDGENIITLVFQQQVTYYYVFSIEGDILSAKRGLVLELDEANDIEENLMNLYLSIYQQITTGGLYKQGESLCMGSEMNSWLIGSAIAEQPIDSTQLTLYHVYPLHEIEIEVAKQVGQVKLLQSLGSLKTSIIRIPIKMPGI